MPLGHHSTAYLWSTPWRQVHESVGMLRQIYLATLDLTIHSEAPPAGVDGLQARDALLKSPAYL